MVDRAKEENGRTQSGGRSSSWRGIGDARLLANAAEKVFLELHQRFSFLSRRTERVGVTVEARFVSCAGYPIVSRPHVRYRWISHRNFRSELNKISIESFLGLITDTCNVVSSRHGDAPD